MIHTIQYFDNYDLACYNGYSFRRDKKTGYFLSAQKIGGKRQRLHRYVWETENNVTIPKGYDIHHKDGNKLNNDISNLILLARDEHQSLHQRNLTDEQRKKRAENLLKNAIPKASKWHKSEQGREWHKQHGKEVFAKLEPIKYICTFCGAEFKTKNRYSKTSNTFCSNKCKSAFRRASGVDNVIRECVQCGEPFTANKYSTAKRCEKCRCKKH